MVSQGSTLNSRITIVCLGVMPSALIQCACGLPDGPTSSAVSSVSSTSTGGTSDQTATTSSSTSNDTHGPESESETAVVAMCGNGDVEGDEECDDGNTDNDDGCDQACVRVRHVFLSSMHFQGSLEGLLGADQKCQALATLARLKRPTQYKAWLSDSTESPATRFHRSPGRYSLLSGTTIADSWDDLTDGTLDNPINETELGDVLDFVGVFTNTEEDGSVLDASYSCEDWTTVVGETLTWIGSSGHANSEWTDSVIANPTSCALNGHLYCFEQ